MSNNHARCSLRAKKCRACKAEFTPTRPLQMVCSFECALAYARVVKASEEAKADRMQRAKLKTRAQWMKEAQTEFNRYIRHRDDNLPCISCGTATAKQWHAGHYRTTKAAPELRFDEANCHKQCSQCNDYLSGNIQSYRANLINKIGKEDLEKLEGHHEAKKYTIDDLKGIKSTYMQKRKEQKWHT